MFLAACNIMTRLTDREGFRIGLRLRVLSGKATVRELGQPGAQGAGHGSLD